MGPELAWFCLIISAVCLLQCECANSRNGPTVGFTLAFGLSLIFIVWLWIIAGTSVALMSNSIPWFWAEMALNLGLPLWYTLHTLASQSRDAAFQVWVWNAFIRVLKNSVVFAIHEKEKLLVPGFQVWAWNAFIGILKNSRYSPFMKKINCVCWNLHYWTQTKIVWLLLSLAFTIVHVLLFVFH